MACASRFICPIVVLTEAGPLMPALPVAPVPLPLVPLLLAPLPLLPLPAAPVVFSMAAAFMFAIMACMWPICSSACPIMPMTGPTLVPPIATVPIAPAPVVPLLVLVALAAAVVVIGPVTPSPARN